LKPGRRGLSGGGVVYIREIARNLYQLKKRLEELEQAYETETTAERREELQLELYKTRQEYKRIKSILEGAKESS
jgi:DNA-binding transcriptional regulator GbsR (MarR family)